MRYMLAKKVQNLFNSKIIAGAGMECRAPAEGLF